MTDSQPLGEALAESPGFGEVLRCVFGIREHEAETYLALLDHPDSTAADLAAVLDRDRSNVSRSLSTLREKGVVGRRRVLLDGGGHVYCYTAEPVETVRRRLHESLDAWTAAAHDRIDAFGEAANAAALPASREDGR